MDAMCSVSPSSKPVPSVVTPSFEWSCNGGAMTTLIVQYITSSAKKNKEKTKKSKSKPKHNLSDFLLK